VDQGLPTGTVTLLFTDIEGSTRLLHEIGAEAYAEALAQHRHVLRNAFAGHGGVEVDTQADAFFYATVSPGLLGTFTVEADSQPHEPRYVEPEQSDDHEVECTCEIAH